MNDFLKEKELLLNSIENNTSEHWKNYYKDVPVECIYDDLVIDINEIKRLQNNWNELKKCIDDRLKRIQFRYEERFISRIELECRKLELNRFKSKMQELEQGKDD